MRMLFDADLSVERLIPALSIESGTRITPEDTLVIFDEVQARCLNESATPVRLEIA